VQFERYQQIKSLLLDALEQPSSARAAWLAQRCGSDSELRLEVEELLAGENQASFMERSPLAEMALAPAPEIDARRFHPSHRAGCRGLSKTG
jgi:hypothetical protein